MRVISSLCNVGWRHQCRYTLYPSQFWLSCPASLFGRWVLFGVHRLVPAAVPLLPLGVDRHWSPSAAWLQTPTSLLLSAPLLEGFPQRLWCLHLVLPRALCVVTMSAAAAGSVEMPFAAPGEEAPTSVGGQARPVAPTAKASPCNSNDPAWVTAIGSFVHERWHSVSIALYGAHSGRSGFHARLGEARSRH